MVYTLAFEGCHGTEPPEGRQPVEAEVAVFFPDRLDWTYFRHAVDACVSRGLARRVGEGEGSAVVATPGLGRRVRFSWHGIRGVGETRDEVDRLVKRVPPPVAVVGSTTTVLTATLAEPLRDKGPAGPVLLVPWATAVMSPRSEAGENATPLLGIDPGRTFRFCPNNRKLAESVVDCVIDQDEEAAGPGFPGRRPARPVLGRPGGLLSPGDPKEGRDGRDYRKGRRRGHAFGGPIAGFADDAVVGRSLVGRRDRDGLRGESGQIGRPG